MSRPGLAGKGHAVVLARMYPIPPAGSWGIGDTPVLARFSAWLDSAGCDFLQLLPVNEMADGQNSPYSAMSAMGIDPIYIALAEVEEFSAAGGERSLADADRARLDEARRSRLVAYPIVREIKSSALAAAFDRFERTEWQGQSSRATAFREFMDRERWWLDDYALFRALHEEHEGRYWLEWDEGLRVREPSAIEAAR